MALRAGVAGLGVWHLLDTVPRPPHTPGPQARPYTTNTFIEGRDKGRGTLSRIQMTGLGLSANAD